MIELQSITLHRGDKTLLEDASLRIHPGEKTALVGANGAGKTSLFLLLQGRLQVDRGSVSIPADWRIAHMAQEVAAGANTALDFVLDGDTELRRIEQALAVAEDDHRLAQLYGEPGLCGVPGMAQNPFSTDHRVWTQAKPACEVIGG